MATVPWGFQWRSSKSFIVACMTIALFSDTFLYGYIVPILSYMLEDRLQLDSSRTQSLTSAILAIHGAVAIVTSPIIGHFADQFSNRKTSLLYSLSASLVGTILVACAPSLWMLFLGRVLQGISASAIWIVGLATIANAVGEEHMGKIMGVVNSFLTAGVILGPVVSGLLLRVAGYWGTWVAPLVVLGLDMIARLVMIESPQEPKAVDSASAASTTTSPSEAISEDTALLAEENAAAVTGYQSTSSTGNIPDLAKHDADLSTTSAFYHAMLTNGRVVSALLISSAASSVLTSFEATLPLHVRDVFGWGPSVTGAMFFCLEIPSVFMGPLSGWVRDRVGVRMPTTLGLVALAPLLWLLGVPGDEKFPWASADTRGYIIYVACMFGIGAVSPFLSGVGILELTAVIKEYSAKNPNIFGPNGGYSRAYSICDVAAAVAMMLGPIISGSLHQLIGYYYMNLTFGRGNLTWSNDVLY
ncbi:major facilitator superfamily domain-containing protein [Aspergillus egyptiacus]|nr:major facilitator superfamily domain-containing protein [Aspergillus egyptiacus]